MNKLRMRTLKKEKYLLDYLFIKSMCILENKHKEECLLKILESSDNLDDKMLNLLTKSMIKTNNPDFILKFSLSEKLNKKNMDDLTEYFLSIDYNFRKYTCNFIKLAHNNSKQNINKLLDQIVSEGVWYADYLLNDKEVPKFIHELLLKKLVEYKKTHIISFYNLSKFDRELVNSSLEIICSKGKSREIYNFYYNNFSLSFDKKLMLIDSLCKTDDVKLLIKISEDVKNLPYEKSFIEKIEDALIRIRDIEHIYNYLKNTDNFVKKQELINVILYSLDYKYIILTALYIDNTLIYKLFNNVNEMYLFIVDNALFSEEELEEITEFIYGKSKTDISTNIDEKVYKYIYETKLQKGNN